MCRGLPGKFAPGLVQSLVLGLGGERHSSRTGGVPTLEARDGIEVTNELEYLHRGWSGLIEALFLG